MQSTTTNASTVFITVPKFITLPKIRPAPATAMLTESNNVKTVSISPGSSCGYTSSTTSDDGSATKSRKRRLDHLTWEEKMQRKKLKNRVAAQTSRDRKKARMEDMQHEIKELQDRTELLQNKCESLQAINDTLYEKNHKLHYEIDELRQSINELQKQNATSKPSSSSSTTTTSETKPTVTCIGCETILNGSAVSYTDPLQQGSIEMKSQAMQAQLKKSNMMSALWKIVTYCLLYKICSKSTMMNSMPAGLKNLQKAYSQISQQTWKQAIDRAMKLLPKLQAEQSDCLDQWWGPQQNAWNPTDMIMQLKQQRQSLTAQC